MERVVVPEILDELEGRDPRAVRSRRDLRLINALMGNERWIAGELGKLEGLRTVTEMGAGRGELVNRLAGKGWTATGYDLQPKPESLVKGAQWREGDFFQSLGEDGADAVVGSLILHHFQDSELKVLGELLKAKKVLLFAEPLRCRLALWEGWSLFPFVNGVTRHDMMVSIRAGFVPGELPQKLGLVEGWHWREERTLLGGLRSVAIRETL